jgi:hypothetical protein
MTSKHDKRKSRRVRDLKPTFIQLKGKSLKVHDISNDGLSLLLPDEGPSFTVGELLPEIPLPLASGTVHVQGVVSHVSYTAAAKMCGIRFLFEGSQYESVISFIRERLGN